MCNLLTTTKTSIGFQNIIQGTIPFISFNIEPSACFNRQFYVTQPKLSENNS